MGHMGLNFSSFEFVNLKKAQIMLEKDQTVKEKITKIIKMIEMARLGEFWHDDGIPRYTCVYLQLLNTKLNQFNTKRPQILGFPTSNSSISESMRMSWWSYLVMLSIYLLYLFIGAGRVFNATVALLYCNSEQIAIKNLQLKSFSVI